MHIKQIIIWGHYLHSHTHSYIHNAFYKSFRYLGYDTYWFDDNTDVSQFNFENSLFISEHQVDYNIPKRDDCLYFIHFIDKARYADVPVSNIINLKCAFRDTKRDIKSKICNNVVPVNNNNLEFYTTIDDILVYYMLWGTDLLPYEIQNNIDNIKNIQKKRTRTINFIGTLTEPFHILYLFCNKNNIQFNKYGATFNINNKNNKSVEDNVNLIQESYIAPSFQNQLQVKDSYIPCRIFKNISYGRMSATNNHIVYSLFNNKIIYDSDINNCILKSINFESLDESERVNIISDLMYFVKDNHTFVNRINIMKEFINNYTPFSI